MVWSTLVQSPTPPSSKGRYGRPARQTKLLSYSEANTLFPDTFTMSKHSQLVDTNVLSAENLLFD